MVSLTGAQKLWIELNLLNSKTESLLSPCYLGYWGMEKLCAQRCTAGIQHFEFYQPSSAYLPTFLFKLIFNYWHLGLMIQSGWSPIIHLTHPVNPYSNAIAQAFNALLLPLKILFASQILSTGQGQVQVLLCPQSCYLLFLGLLIIFSHCSTMFTIT